MARKPLIGITLDIDGEYLRLKHYYSSAIIKAGGNPVLIPIGNDVSTVAGMIDGLLIPGGRDIDPSYFQEEPYPSVKIVPRERTDFEILLLGAVMETRKPVFGICYGMQMINVAFGGNLYQDIEGQCMGAIDHRSGEHSVKLIASLSTPPEADNIQQSAISNQLRLRRTAFIVNSSHHQAVKQLGDGLDVLALSEDGIIEGVYKKDYPFLVAVQWHPERSDDDLSIVLLRSFVEHTNAAK